MKTTRTTLIAGIILIAVGVAGLLFVGGSGRWGDEDGRPHGFRGPMTRPPMMRGFGNRPMWGGPGRGVLPPVAGARTIDIVATDRGLEPSQVTVTAGEAVNIRLVNQGTVARGLMIPGLGLRFMAVPGQSVTTGFRVDRPGEYPFFSGIPGRFDAGVAGKIIVTP